MTTTSMKKSKTRKPKVEVLDEPNGDLMPWRDFDFAESQRQTLAFLKILTGADTMAEAAAKQMFWRLIRPDSICGMSSHRALVGSYRELQKQLLEKNLTAGYGIYVMANVPDFNGLYYDGFHRAHCYEADIVSVRCLYADFDQKLVGEPLDLERICTAAPIPPSFGTRTGGGLHLYWGFRNPKVLLSDTDRVYIKGMLLTLSKVLAKHGADPQFISMAQCPRVPGFLNTKPGRWPLPMVRMTELPCIDGVGLYDFRTLSRAFPPAPEARFWSGSFKIEDATGYTIDEASEDLLERAYEILDGYEGGPRDSGFSCSSQIMSASAKLIRLGLHPDAVEELVEEEVNQYIDPPYEDVGRKVGDAWRRFKQQEAQQRAMEAELDAEFSLADDGK